MSNITPEDQRRPNVVLLSGIITSAQRSVAIWDYLNFHLRQLLTHFFFLSMLSSTAYGRNIIPPHICYSIIVQMVDILVNCTSAPYIIKICDFVALWGEDNIRRELSSFVQNIYR
jgi:hypothetical protein